MMQRLEQRLQRAGERGGEGLDGSRRVQVLPVRPRRMQASHDAYRHDLKGVNAHLQRARGQACLRVRAKVGTRDVQAV